MTKEERLQRALKYGDFYDLALLTYERSKNMKIKVNQIKSEEVLQRFGNKFFTQRQIEEIQGA